MDTMEHLSGGRGMAVDAGRMGDWASTYTGRRFYPADPRAEDVDILDIAVALGNQARYNGHCRFYSVAEHSLLVSRMVSPGNALVGLMHDATEAYLSDLSRPVKRTLMQMGDGGYFGLEDLVWKRAIAPAFGLPMELPDEVKRADTAICMSEKALLHPRASRWDFTGYEDPKVHLRLLTPDLAAHHFLRRFAELTGADAGTLQERHQELRGHDDSHHFEVMQTYRRHSHYTRWWP